MKTRIRRRLLITVILLILLLSLIWTQSWWLPYVKMLATGNVTDLVSMIRSFGIWAPLISILFMVFQAFIAPIPSFLITGANGLVFGLFWGVVISWIGAMIGASGTFYLARFFGEKFVRRFEKSHHLLEKVDEISKEYGSIVIFIGRLLPFVSFDFLSYAAGLSRIESWKFLIATGIGMLPGTIAYVLVGEGIGTGQLEWPLLVGLILLVTIIYIIYRKWNKNRTKNKD